jgi:predicted peroxiredoxin
MARSRRFASARGLTPGRRVPFLSFAMASTPLLLVLTAGLKQDGGRRAALAFGVGLAALAGGREVSVFLSLESAPFGTPTGCDGAKPQGFSDPLDAYVRHFLELGGKMEICSSCYEEYCRDRPKNARGETIVREGTTIASLGSVAERAGSWTVLTF